MLEFTIHYESAAQADAGHELLVQATQTAKRSENATTEQNATTEPLFDRVAKRFVTIHTQPPAEGGHGNTGGGRGREGSWQWQCDAVVVKGKVYFSHFRKPGQVHIRPVHPSLYSASVPALGRPTS